MDDIQLKWILGANEYQILDIRIDRIIKSSVLDRLELPKGMDGRKGVIINGRAPVWLYAALVHLCHASAWIATNDPRLGAVVVASHVPEREAGEVVPLEEFAHFLAHDAVGG